jgi:nucleotide-binding universal stress UspA family protein
MEVPMYRKILVPLDGSVRAERILVHVENLAVTQKSEILLMQVVQTVITTDGYRTISYQESMAATERAFKESDLYLRELAERMTKSGCKVQTITRTGSVVETILETALKEEADLIAMASHGRSGLGRVFYGSVAAGIIHRIDRPMLLIRSRDGQ